MLMDLGLLVDVVWKVGTLMGFGWMYLANRDKVTNGRISTLQEEIDKKLDIHAERLTSLEKEVEMGPNHEHLSRLHGRIDDLAGALKRIEGESSSQTRILNLVYESLIKGPK